MTGEVTSMTGWHDQCQTKMKYILVSDFVTSVERMNADVPKKDTDKRLRIELATLRQPLLSQWGHVSWWRFRRETWFSSDVWHEWTEMPSARLARFLYRAQRARATTRKCRWDRKELAAIEGTDQFLQALVGGCSESRARPGRYAAPPGVRARLHSLRRAIAEFFSWLGPSGFFRGLIHKARFWTSARRPWGSFFARLCPSFFLYLVVGVGIHFLAWTTKVSPFPVCTALFFSPGRSMACIFFCPTVSNSAFHQRTTTPMFEIIYLQKRSLAQYN
jgi:hypothetical protein